MNTQSAAITSEVTRAENYICATFSHSKTEAFVCIHADYIQVVMTSSAAHRAYRGSGKFFRDMNEARKNYKSDSMQEILSAADALNA